MIRIPPGGFLGWGNQTAAVQALLAPRRRKTTRRKKATTRKKPARRRVARRKVAKKRPARLVKGSAAAKRHMAKLRKMRKG